MKKKNLIILLLMPFIVALLSIVTINMTFNLIENDILSIEWDYKDIEGFKLQDVEYQLKAKGVSNSRYPVSSGNNLVWEVENQDNTDQTIYAEIVERDNKFYLKTYEEGTVVITCRNEKNTVYRYMTAVIYKNGVILANPKVSGSQTNIDSNIYYGEYDIDSNHKVSAKISYDFVTIPSNIKNMMVIKDQTDNISIDLKNNEIDILNSGSASFTLGIETEGIAKDQTVNFEVVENGVNCYTYDDLLYCTNKSGEGEIVVLRKTFESLENACYFDSDGLPLETNGNVALKRNNVALFGNYNTKTKKFNFEDDVYRFKTTFNSEFIDQWNKFTLTNSSYSKISDNVIAGLRIQKDFYGNGYTINMHNLTFPYGEHQIQTSTGTQYVPMLTDDNLFRGPLPFYALGDPNAMPLIEIYGQDNMALYLDGNDIVINDAHIKNCDYGNTLSNLDYVGNVCDINGDNNTILNSRLQNGKNIIRSFSSNNLIIKNSMLSDARNFHITTGSNEYEKINDSNIKSFKDLNGELINDSIINYFDKTSENESYANSILSKYLSEDIKDKEGMKSSIQSMNMALNEAGNTLNNYKGSITIDDVIFYRSGISSIAFETLFNGPFLYSNVPSMVEELFGLLQSNGKSLIPFQAQNISGISYPVMVNITGDTKFYDYKDIETMDISGLINENISNFANNLADYANMRKITIDDIFPIKKMLIDEARKNGYLYTDLENSKTYINVPIAYYGGGLNQSIMEIDSNSYFCKINENVYFDLVDSYLDLQSGNSDIKRMQNMILKLVTTAIGYEPFEFTIYNGNGYLYGETPQITDLRNNE